MNGETLLAEPSLILTPEEGRTSGETLLAAGLSTRSKCKTGKGLPSLWALTASVFQGRAGQSDAFRTAERAKQRARAVAAVKGRYITLEPLNRHGWASRRRHCTRGHQRWYRQHPQQETAARRSQGRKSKNGRINGMAS
jgi:hypothetical protein